MNTWILIVSFATGLQYGYEYAIPGLPSYEECVRVSKQIPPPHYRNQEKAFKCIEVIGAKK